MDFMYPTEWKFHMLLSYAKLLFATKRPKTSKATDG